MEAVVEQRAHMANGREANRSEAEQCTKENTEKAESFDSKVG